MSTPNPPIEELDMLAYEGDTYPINVTFRDDAGELMVPDTLSWTLTDAEGTVQNDQANVTVDTPMSSVDIVLSGDDLQTHRAALGAVVTRLLTLSGTFSSDLGDDLPIYRTVKFKLVNLPTPISQET